MVDKAISWYLIFSQYKLLYLLPWFQPSPSARRRLEGSFTDPISGPLAVLPTEVLGAIVAALLELKPGAPQCLVLASAHWLCNFLRTCRGASAAVSRAQLLDAVARIHVRLTPMPGAEPDRAYYTLSLSHLRSVMETKAMVVGLRAGVSHCASITGACCRGARMRFNQDMRSLSHYGVDPTTAVGALALEAMGSGRTRMCAAVAGGLDTLLLCQTARGAAIYSRRSSYVRCVEAHSPESPLVYSPDGELATAFHKDLEEGDLVVMGASGGDLLVLLLARRTALESGGSEGFQHELHTWDMTTNTLLDTRQCGSVDLLWVCNDVVYRLGSTDPEDAMNQYSAAIDYFQPRGTPVECRGSRWTMPRISTHRTVCTSLWGGHLAMVNPSTTVLAEEILFVDVGMARFATVHAFPRRARDYSEDYAHSLIELSPAGDTMVYIGRALAKRCVSIYRRDPKYLNRRTASKDFEEDELLGWSRTHYCTQALLPEDRLQSTVRVNSAFSPCGGRVCFFFDSTHGSECMIIDLRTTFHPHMPSKEIAITAHKVLLGSQPKAIVWSSDGIYLQTNFQRVGTASGVVRIGSL